MIQKYKVGDIAYIVESNQYVREGQITYICGDILTIKFLDCMGSTKIKAHRLFPTEESAVKFIKQHKPLSQNHLRTIRN